MKINEVNDIRIDEDGSTYRQSFLDKLVEAATGDWEDAISGEDYVNQLKESQSRGEISW